MSHTNGISNSQQLMNTTLNQADKTAATYSGKSTTEVVAKQPATKTADSTASLSGAGSLLAAAAANTDDVRTEKVESIKAAIANGSYSVPAEKVADKLIDNMLG